MKDGIVDGGGEGDSDLRFDGIFLVPWERTVASCAAGEGPLELSESVSDDDDSDSDVS